MLIRKAYKFKLKTDNQIEQKLVLFSGHCRFVWNKVFHYNMDLLAKKKPIMRYQESTFWLQLWKQSEEYSFLNECHSQVLQQKLMDLDRAFLDGFDKKQPNKKLPNKKKKGISDSFRYNQGFKLDNRRIFLPKIGWVGFHKSQNITGKPKNITISKKAGSWYAAIQVETEIEVSISQNKSAVGIDMGVANFATLSNGKIYEPLNSFKKLQNDLAKQQRKLAKKQKFSNNWQKQVKKIQVTHNTIANARKDYLHKASNEICKNHATIYIEDLKVANMSKSAKGTLENKGRNVKAKSGLNKSILDQGWYEFRRQLEYKAFWLNQDVIAVDAKYTSQKCSCCGYKAKENRQSQAIFQC